MFLSAHTVTGADIYFVCLCMHTVVLNCSVSSEIVLYHGGALTVAQCLLGNTVYLSAVSWLSILQESRIVI